jgi:hypothetical protein
MLSMNCVTASTSRRLYMFPDSSATGSYILVLINGPFSQLSFARAGDLEWIWLPRSANYEDCIYMGGLLYAVTSIGEINVFDLNGLTISNNTMQTQNGLP